MKMGLEKKLLERIPEISKVEQAAPVGPPLVMEEVNVVLESVRPFLAVAGGTIECLEISGAGTSAQPTVKLKMGGASASLRSVRLEIQQRVQRHFLMPSLKVAWEEPPKQY
jgi:lysyl-tRNA synthetase class 2